MFSVLWTVIFVVVINAIIATIGSDNIGELAWTLWVTLIPSPASKKEKKLREVQKAAIALGTEISGVSAQDEFATWAKLNRKMDKLKDEMEKLNAGLGAQRAFFKVQVRRAVWVSTTGLKFLVRIKYRKAPVFWLPKGMFPGWIEWVLSLTSAPKGSVSVAVWFMVVDYAIKGTVVYILTKSVQGVVYIRSEKLAKVQVKAKSGKPAAEDTSKSSSESAVKSESEKKTE
ncbi:CHD5-like protein-domain-containing protein [Myxozyma melibiosi]|uniref:Golgi to ER traffic protein 1 n=1 Tax=Myxozyma melibiosi TaxID=54550 RepID=A0ABR1FER9_9ASCO